MYPVTRTFSVHVVRGSLGKVLRVQRYLYVPIQSPTGGSGEPQCDCNDPEAASGIDVRILRQRETY